MKNAFYVTALCFISIWAISFFIYKAGGIIHVLPVMGVAAYSLSFLRLKGSVEMISDTREENSNEEETIAGINEQLEANHAIGQYSNAGIM